MLRGAVAQADAAAMRQLVEEEWMHTDPAEFVAPTSRHPPPPEGHKTHFPNAHYAHPLFDALNCNPHILRVVAGLLMGKPRLSQCTVAHMTKSEWKQSQPAKLHRDDHGFKMPAGFRNPFNDCALRASSHCHCLMRHNRYNIASSNLDLTCPLLAAADQTAAGEIYCSHVATWVALAPVPEATGFAVVPGSVRTRPAAATTAGRCRRCSCCADLADTHRGLHDVG